MSATLAPTLSICIPTFNRSGYLEQTLQQLSRCMTRLGAPRAACVEVLVMDNCSTDDTAEMITRMSQQLPNLHYRGSATNIGVERNIVRAMQGGHGEWVWPLGDDDILAEDALVTILDTIAAASSDLGLVLLNYAQVRQDGRELMSSRVCDVPDGWHGDLFGDGGLHRYRGGFDLLGFISALVLRRRLLRFDVDYAAYNSYYGHVGIVCASCANYGVKVIAPGTMTQRQLNTRADANDPKAATALLQTDTFAGITVMLRALVEVSPASWNIYHMSCKEGLGELAVSQAKPILHWAFDAFAKKHLVSITENHHDAATQDQLLSNFIPFIEPGAARNVVVDFRQGWLFCRAAFKLYEGMRKAL